MARRQIKTNSRRGKKNFDPIAVAGAVGTGAYVLDLAKKHVMPSQGTVNRFVRGENPKVSVAYPYFSLVYGYPLGKRDPVLMYRTGGYKKEDEAKQAAFNKIKSGDAIDQVLIFKRHNNSDHQVDIIGGGRLSSERRGKSNPEDIDFLNDAAPYQSLGHIEFTPDGIERYVRDGYVYMAFSSTPVFGDGYRMGTPEESAELYAVKNPAKYERCVRAVQARGGANGYAVCNKLRRNPESTSADLYEQFHGTPSTEILEIVEDLHVHGNLGGLGQLVEMYVVMPGQYKTTLIAPNPDGKDAVQVCGTEDGNNVYFRGGDESIDVEALGFKPSVSINHEGESFESSQIKDSMLLGYVHKLTYRTEKAFDDFETVDYYHRVGEDTKKCPMLIYDTLNALMSLAGGEYTIAPQGIVN